MTTAEPAEGTVGPGGDFQPVPDENVTPVSQESLKSNVDVAKEVIAGHWGRGNATKKKLRDAGYDVPMVDSEVAKLMRR